ncbi:MAG: transposase [bacterium]
MKRARTFVFLDNLVLHHTVLVREKAKSNLQELVFNASYSSPLNPIERLWALAKR